MKKLLLPLLALAVLALPARAAISNVETIAPGGFARGVVLTVDGYAANRDTLTNFPVLVRVSNGTIPGFSYSDINFPAKANADICFVAEDGTPLAFDIDTWDTSANATSLVWVTLPTMVHGTEFAMFYKGQTSGKDVCGGNAFTNYVGVWHLGDPGDANAIVYDSTPNSLTGDASSRSLAVPAGRIGAARTITTQREKANYGITIRKNAASLAALDTLDTSFVVSFWMRPVGAVTSQDAGIRYNELIGRKPATGTAAWQLQLAANSKDMRLWSSQTADNKVTTTGQILPLVQNQWTKVDVVYKPASCEVFANGVSKGSFTSNYTVPVQGSDTLSIGSQPTGGERSFWGDMDEVRLVQFDGTVAGAAGSADWVKADYDQVNTPGFLSASAITEIAVVAKPLATLALADSGAAYAQFAGQINGLGGDTATECFVRAKAWPTGTAEPAGWTTIASGLALYDTFTGVLVDLLPQTPYDFKIQAVNDITEESDVASGTFTTSGAGEIGSGGDIKRVGDSIVHTFKIAKDGTDDFEFVPPSYATSVEALVVAGGGAGGYRRGGGGGAGGLLHFDAFPVTGGATYDIAVGAGGAASGSYTEFGGNGMPSSISSNGVALVTTVGGGAGGNGDSSCATAMCKGQDGGSGGGSGAKVNVSTEAGAGVSGQGYAGGTGRPDKENNKWGGGGGGANSAGGSVAQGTTVSGGNGGAGEVYSISGEEVTYAGGGGGGGEYSQKDSTTAGPSSGGAGGGGKGGQKSAEAGTEVAESGKPGTGGGGGGGSNESGSYQGGDGGSGIVILRYAVQGNGQGMNAPAIALESLDRNDGTGVTTIGYRLAWAGDNYDYADVKVAWGFAKNDLPNTNAIASSVIGRGTGTFTLPDQTKTVYVRAVAVNAGGYGAASPEVVTIPFVDPEAPEVEQPVVSNISGTGASFSAAVTSLGEGATSVRGVFQVSTDDEFEGTVLSFPAAETLTAAGSLTATATGLAPNTAYYVRVSATNDVPDFFETEPVSFRTAVPGAPNGSVVTDLTQVANPPAACEPPVATDTTITAWGYLFNPGNNGASYANLRIEASTTANFQSVAAYTETESNVPQRGYRSFTLTGLAPETDYYLRLRMENDGRVVAYSAVVGPFATLAPVTMVSLTFPAMPENVSVSSVTTNGVAVAAVNGAYVVEVGAEATVTFAAAAGYVLSGASTATITVDDDTVFPSASIPTATAETATLTVRTPPANVTLVSVTVDGGPVEGVNGVYTVYSNATVVATFAAASGHRLVGSATVSVFMDGDKTLATADMPTAEALPIPEVGQSAKKVYAKKTVTLTASAEGATSYRWLKNGEPIEGGTNGTLTVAWRSPKNDPTDTYQAVAVYTIDGSATDSGASTAMTVTNLPMGTVIIVRGGAPAPPPPHDYSADYLTFRVRTPGTICWKAFGDLTKTSEYKINDGEWTSIASTSDGATISVAKGDLVRFRQNNIEVYATKRDVYSGFEGGTATYDIEGNIMSLLYGDDFAESTTLPDREYVFCSLFKNAPVVSAENLVLPATTLKPYCYRAMFSGCTTLTKAPELPATTLATGCYWYMFDKCAITEAPELPATTLATGCYGYMFLQCPITKAPVLKAATLVKECYGHMFEGCGLLNRITCLATSGFDASNCLTDWVKNVAGDGAFAKAAGVTSWKTGANGIPTGWIVCEDVLLLPPEVSFYGDEIELECETEGAEIHYRLGQTGEFSLYTQTISIVGDAVVEAYSTYQGHTSPTGTQTCVYVSETPFERSNKDLPTWRYGGGTVTTPYSVNREDGHSNSYAKGIFAFDTSVTLKAAQPTYLWFQHADQSADIYVDGEKVGTHWGGYNAFFFDISEYVHRGRNDIRVALCNTTRNTLAPAAGDFNFNATLGNVKLFTSPVLPAMEYGYDGFHITSTVSVSSATTNATIYVETKVPAGADLKCIVSDASYAWTNTVESTGSKQTFSTTISNAHLWNGTLDPHLYTVTLEIYKDGDLYHRYERPYGFRYYSYVINETVNGQTYTGFLLNGQPYQLRGVCMHDDVEGKANALTDADYDQEFDIIDELGCNFIRLAHYPHPKEVYDRCDQRGIIVQTEVPCVNKLQTSMPDDYYTHLTTQYTEMVQQHYNHPCIVFWGLSNETQTDDKNFGKEKINGYYDLIKDLDSERLVGYVMSHGTDNPSGYYNDPKVDWFGCNIYVGWYIDQNSNDPSSRLNTRLTKTLTRLGKPIAFSEYGCGGTQHCHSTNCMATTTRGNNPRHDIEYQMWLHEGHIAAIRNYPQLLFTSQWQLFDIAVANRNEGFTECLDGVNVTTNDVLRRLNNKGLVERDHRTKKDTFYLYKAEWNSKDKFVHICGKDYTKTTGRALKCYTNDGDTLSLYIGDNWIEDVGVVDHIATFTATNFPAGVEIRVEGTDASDTVTFQ